MKIAVIHDWLTTYAGSERVLEQIIQLFPEADLYSLFDFLPPDERRFILNKPVQTSFLQNLPLVRKFYRNYLPIMPLAVESLDLKKYDLIISSCHAVIKGVRVNARQLHICYCHTPIRYAWDLQDQYLKEAGIDAGVRGALARFILQRIQRWDLRTVGGVGRFVANSSYIAERIQRIYGRGSVVIYPPVDTEKFCPGPQKEDYYLAASRMVPYKRMDLIVSAFSKMPEKRLVVIGDGPDLQKIKNLAGNNIELIGYQRPDSLKEFLQRARAFIFVAVEDFGILPVEAMACGTPVIAYGKGGVAETVIPYKSGDYEKIQPTGIFLNEQSEAALMQAVQRFEKVEHVFDSYTIRQQAEKFGRQRFRNEFKDFVENEVNFFFNGKPSSKNQIPDRDTRG